VATVLYCHEHGDVIIMTVLVSSPTLSVTSADEALYELLGIDKLSLNEDDDDENEAAAVSSSEPSSSCCSSSLFAPLTPPPNCQRPHTPHGSLLLCSTPHLLSRAQCRYIIYNLGYAATNNGGKSYGPTYVTKAAHHHSSSTTSNENEKNGHDSGTSISSSSSSSSSSSKNNNVQVELLDPNHHKVCVFKSELVLEWIQRAFLNSGIHDAITRWLRTNYHDYYNNTNNNQEAIDDDDDNNNNNESSSSSYRINPRLRLLRYDAKDDDTFLAHYDGTTTTTIDGGWESKLTILIYLNTGGGTDFVGGNTLFLNALEPNHNTKDDDDNNNNNNDTVSVTPQGGRMVIFNHELYHASQELQVRPDLVMGDDDDDDDDDEKTTVVGGTKFVLRTDVMIPTAAVSSSSQSRKTNDGDNNNNNDAVLVADSTMTEVFSSNDEETTTTTTSVKDVILLFSSLSQEIMNTDTSRTSSSLLQVLQDLDMEHLPVRTFLVPGPDVVTCMLVDLGLDKDVVDTFVQHCVDAAAR
jgi:uncharacterized protein YgfB (UPF0149 family)